MHWNIVMQISCRTARSLAPLIQGQSNVGRRVGCAERKGDARQSIALLRGQSTC